MTHPGVLQCCRAVQVLAALRQEQTGVVAVINALVDVQGHTSQGADHLLQAGKVDDHELVNVNVGQLLNGLDGAGDASADRFCGVAGAYPVGKGGVELSLPLLGGGAVGGLAAGDVHDGVPGDGDHVDPGAVCGDVHNQGGVGAGDHDLLATLRVVNVVGPGARVGPQDEDVDGDPGVVVGDGFPCGAVRHCWDVDPFDLGL